MDSRDNSITFSKGLSTVIDAFSLNEAKVLTFSIPERDTYAFTINPKLDENTQLADIMYNAKYKSVGYECLVPTVNAILYKYGFPFPSRVRIDVRRTRIGDNVVYEFKKPRNGRTNKLYDSIRDSI